VHAQLRERGVLINLTADKVLRFFPPLTVPENDLDRALGSDRSAGVTSRRMPEAS